ncbi:E3 ubiquitin-protein ligase TRIP12-like [Harmonia axyridis]|uniref:E3 ubiquitin-protein ligase TRIP12-like n=1 Tax=Harmonia axyridis TaxID=115357 RepID=UPI001E277E09|nr:E3 ubiquitin-protein ligase TRIP12-like [Harmonia axyridis]
MQHFMFSRKHESSYHGWSIVPNKRFATKSTFSLNGILLSPQMTIYEIIMKYGVVGHESNVFDHQYIFLYQQYEVHFPPNEENNPDLNEEIMKPTYLLENYLKPRSSECEELTEEVENALHLTNILYGINEHWTSAYEQILHPKVLIDPQDFVNTRLNKCVFKRLLDPFAALMGKYPPWIKYIFDHCPFVFPLGTRIFGFRVLYLNRVRALHSVLWKYERYNLAVYIYETIITLSIERSDIVNDVKKYIFHTRPSLFWGVVFNNEIGAGRGLRKELFNSIGKELQKDKYNIWTSTEETQNGFVQFNEGLYPKLDFCSHLDFYDESSSDGADLFITIGALLAKALMECSLLGLPLATPIFKYLLNQHFPLDFDDLKYVNPSVHKVLGNIRKLITERDKILDNNELTHSEKLSLVKNLTINGANLECYNLNFVLPGHEGIELIPDGANTSVDIMNAHVYVDAIMKKLFVGVQKQMSALKWGFDHVIQFSNLHMFHPKELQYIILGEEDDSSYWSYENLTNHVKLEYCTVDDIEIQDLFDILSSANKETRRNFLEFVTGGSRLPMGGFAELNPKLTIVLVGEYPSAQTCFRLLRLQRGMDHSELKKFIEEIIPEALNYFGLV